MLPPIIYYSVRVKISRNLLKFLEIFLYLLYYGKVVSLLIYLTGGGILKKKEYEKGSFGAYFVKLIKEHNYSQTRFAMDLGVSKTYLFDVFNGRVKPPTPDMQERIVKLLDLSDDEKEDFYSKAADGRDELPKDIFDYLKGNDIEINRLREVMANQA